VARIVVTPTRDGQPLPAFDVAPADRSFAVGTTGTYRYTLRVVDGVGRTATSTSPDVTVLAALGQQPAPPPPPVVVDPPAPPPAVNPPAPPPPVDPPAPPDVDKPAKTSPPVINVQGTATRRQLAKGISVRVTGAKARTEVRLRALRGSSLLATARAKTDSRGNIRVTIKLSKQALKKLSRRKSVTLRTSVVDTRGVRRTIDAMVRIHR
jgi:hypothetical protein